MKKYILIVICLVIVSCQEADSLYKEQLIGTWQQEYKLDNNTILSEVYTFSPDGKFTIEARKIGDSVEAYNILGTWKVRDRHIHYIVNYSSNPRIKIGSEDKNTILSINEKEAITEGKSGRVVTAKRVYQRK